MKRSTTFSEIAKAFIKFKKEHPKVPANDEVVVRNREGRLLYKYYYSALETIIDTVQEYLLGNGLALSQTIGEDNKLTTMLMHESGEFMEDTFSIDSLKERNDKGEFQNYDAKEFGGLVTYARRFAVCSILGIPADTKKKDESITFKNDNAGGMSKEAVAAQSNLKEVAMWKAGELVEIPEAKRAWLNKTFRNSNTKTDDWNNSVAFLTTGNGTIDELKKIFKISRESVTELNNIQLQHKTNSEITNLTEDIKAEINQAATVKDLAAIHLKYHQLHDDAQFLEALGLKKTILQTPSGSIA